jgi:tRNA threonylcarbamoyladenosine biosynthesis protein TsaB
MSVMKILGLELSSARGSLAALSSDDEPVVREWPNDRKHSGLFFENLQSVIEEFGAPAEIIVGLGPGSYAGVRIAIAAAMGLQTASSARLLGFPSICTIETGARDYGVIGDARRQSFFFARIRHRNLVEGPVLLSKADLREKLNKLEASMPIFSCEELPQFSRAALRYPSASVLARLAQRADHGFSMPPLEPIYLREPHITIPKKATVVL